MTQPGALLRSLVCRRRGWSTAAAEAGFVCGGDFTRRWKRRSSTASLAFVWFKARSRSKAAGRSSRSGTSLRSRVGMTRA